MTEHIPLFVYHHPSTCPGVIGELAQLHCSGYEVLFAPNGHFPILPKDRPVVIFGGAMSSNDRDPWLHAERDWIAQLLAHNTPVLGICLGAQLIAKVMGQSVERCEQGSIECGYHPIDHHENTGNASPLPSHVYHWHREGIVWDQRQSSARVLATSPWRGGATQAFIAQSAVGVQFHPEVTAKRIALWHARDPHDLLLPGARPAATHLQDHARHSPSVRQWVEGVLSQQWQVAAPNVLA